MLIAPCNVPPSQYCPQLTQRAYGSKKTRDPPGMESGKTPMIERLRRLPHKRGLFCLTERHADGSDGTT